MPPTGNNGALEAPNLARPTETAAPADLAAAVSDFFEAETPPAIKVTAAMNEIDAASRILRLRVGEWGVILI